MSHKLAEFTEPISLFWVLLGALLLSSTVLVTRGLNMEKKGDNSIRNLLWLSAATILGVGASVKFFNVGVLMHIALLARIYFEYRHTTIGKKG
jgi:hypothetical protein